MVVYLCFVSLADTKKKTSHAQIWLQEAKLESIV